MLDSLSSKPDWITRSPLVRSLMPPNGMRILGHKLGLIATWVAVAGAVAAAVAGCFAAAVFVPLLPATLADADGPASTSSLKTKGTRLGFALHAP